MNPILNESTQTVHKHETGAPELHTECGIMLHANPDHLERMSLERALQEQEADKCGRCFDEGGGY
ncbi:MAG: hypothetical protein ABEI76_00985 [Halobacteriales archaeon]